MENLESKLEIAKRWAERYGYVNVYKGLLFEAMLMNRRRKFFPLNDFGLKQACYWLASVNQDKYRTLPNFE